MQHAVSLLTVHDCRARLILPIGLQDGSARSAHVQLSGLVMRSGPLCHRGLTAVGNSEQPSSFLEGAASQMTTQ